MTVKRIFGLNGCLVDGLVFNLFVVDGIRQGFV